MHMHDHPRQRDVWLEHFISLSSIYIKPLPLGQFIHEFLIFGIKQAWACLFAGVLIVGILCTFFLYPQNLALARYDFLFLLALGMQAALLLLKFERWDEAKVIAIYHLVGTVMELFKTYKGSWLYPEPSIIRIAAVPLFSGFMYSTVGSYIARCWRLFDFHFSNYPKPSVTWLLALLVYINFFSHHYILDFRWALFASIIFVYRRTWIYFKCDAVHRRMPLLLGFFLVTVFIWLAENVGTFSAIWLYPHQQNGTWQPVGFDKFGSWFLLMIISFVLVTAVHRPKNYCAG
jgi:uncharacterized membrane protein YoaT (DUF817 family)